MKQVLILLFPCILLKAAAQNSNGFVIKGELSGLKNNTWLYLIHNKDEGGADTIRRIKSREKKFIFKGKAPFEGEAYFIKIDTIKTKYKKQIKGYITIVLENKLIKLKGSIDQLSRDHIAITGSASHSDYVSFQQVYDSLTKREYDIQNDSSYAIAVPTHDSLLIDSFTRKFETAKHISEQYLLQWISQHPDSYYTPRLISTTSKDMATKINAYNQLSDKAKKSKYGSVLKEEIDRENNTAVGMMAPDFSFPTPEGNELSLKEVVAKGKLTILDFWASWCAPCKDAFPDMKKIYEQYHARGLNILGYSVDEDEGEWEKTLIQYSFPWYNIRETTGDFANKFYGVQGLPKIYVLNAEGRIIAKDLTSRELEKKIAELL